MIIIIDISEESVDRIGEVWVTRRWLRNREGRSRWYSWVALGVVLLSLLFVWMCAHYEVGRVESITGTQATVSVDALNRSFTAEIVDPDLEVGATVVLNIEGADAALVATSPRVVRFIVSVKDLLP